MSCRNTNQVLVSSLRSCTYFNPTTGCPVSSFSPLKYWISVNWHYLGKAFIKIFVPKSWLAWEFLFSLTVHMRFSQQWRKRWGRRGEGQNMPFSIPKTLFEKLSWNGNIDRQ